MRNAQSNPLHPQLFRDLPRLPIQPNRRPPPGLPHHLKTHPPHPPPPPRPQSLHRRLFRRKPPRIPLILILKPLAILPLPHGVNPPQERFPMPLNRRPNPPHLRQIHSHPDNHPTAPCRGAIHCAPNATQTVVLARLALLCELCVSAPLCVNLFPAFSVPHATAIILIRSCPR